MFTQFKEIIPSLGRLLTAAFGRPGLVLHGMTRRSLNAPRPPRMKTFQEDERTPGVFVLSIKELAAQGGLNLTSASHVVPFRSLVESCGRNQATDRAYRIGQKAQCARAQIRLPGNDRGGHRPVDRIETPVGGRFSLTLPALAGINLTKMDDPRTTAACRAHDLQHFRDDGRGCVVSYYGFRPYDASRQTPGDRSAGTGKVEKEAARSCRWSSKCVRSLGPSGARPGA